MEAEYDVTSTESIAAELVRQARLAGVQPNMPPKEGDQKACVDCGETAILEMIPRDAHFEGPDGARPERLEPALGWECSYCGHREWLSN